MQIESIKTHSDYRAVLKEIEKLMTVAPTGAAAKKLDRLLELVESYQTWPGTLQPSN